MIDKKIREVESLAAQIHLRVSISIEEIGDDHTQAQTTQPAAHVNDKNTGSATSAGGPDLAYSILKNYGKPMNKKQLLAAIHANGLNMPATTLTAYLSRYEQFVNVGRGLWKAGEKKTSPPA